MGRDVNKLSDLDIDEVSLVDRGANQHAKVLLHKRDEGVEETEVSESSESEETEVGKDDEHEETRVQDSQEDEMEKGFFSNLVAKILGKDEEEVGKVNPGQQLPYGYPPQAGPAPGPQGVMPGQPVPGMGAPQAFPAGPGQLPGQMQAAPPLPQEVIDYIRHLEQALAQQQGGEGFDSTKEDDVNFGKSAEDLTQDETTFLQELAKSLDDEDIREAVTKAQEAVERANERAEEAEKIAKAEQDIRLNGEFIAKAKGLVNLPVNPEEFGPVMKRMRDALSDEDAEVIEKALSAANETLATAGVFTEIGKRGGAGLDVVSKVESEAEGLRKDSDLTKEQAITKVLEEHPELYDEYISETGRA